MLQTHEKRVLHSEKSSDDTSCKHPHLHVVQYVFLLVAEHATYQELVEGGVSHHSCLSEQQKVRQRL